MNLFASDEADAALALVDAAEALEPDALADALDELAPEEQPTSTNAARANAAANTARYFIFFIWFPSPNPCYHSIVIKHLAKYTTACRSYKPLPDALEVALGNPTSACRGRPIEDALSCIWTKRER